MPWDLHNFILPSSLSLWLNKGRDSLDLNMSLALNLMMFVLQVRGVGTGGIVSTAFCLLYKLFTLKLTRKQVMGLITHTDSPYIRALGFMYIRYDSDPPQMFNINWVSLFQEFIFSFLRFFIFSFLALPWRVNSLPLLRNM